MTGDVGQGRELREAREAAGLSLAQVSRYASCTKSHLSMMESGRRRVYPDVPMAYERAIRELSGDMKRRAVLAGAAMAPLAASELLRRGFAAALRRPSVDEWQARLSDYGADYMTLGASEVRQRLTQDMFELPMQTEEPRMWSVVARTLAIYGKTVSGPREAIRWYRLATESSLRAEDTDTRVWVAGRAALALGYEGAAAPTALRLGREALELSDRPTSGRLNALMGVAHVHAKSGRGEAARDVWQEIQRVYDALSPDDKVSDFNYPYWRLGVIGSLLFARLGDTDTAEHWQSESDKYRPASMDRFRAHIEMHRGLMVARAGDATGVDYARSALEALPEDKRSQSLLLLMEEIRAG